MSTAATPTAVECIDYEELEIEVSQCLCGQAEVRILDSIHDRPREPFHPAYDLDDLNHRLEQLDEVFLLEGGKAASEVRRLAESIGKELYSALLPGRVRQTFKTSLAALRAVRRYQNVGLRLRISFGEASRYSTEVGLPWELLCSPDTLEFPSSAAESPIVRFLDIDQPIEPIEIKPPIRILAAIPAPTDMPPFDRELHENILRGACHAHSDRLELATVEPPTTAALYEALVRSRADGKPVHVVHFLGHGAFDADGEGYLNFERSDRVRDRVLGRRLAALLAGFREVRVAVLATCLGARMMRRKGQHPFAGTAPALLAAGLPAAVGMQFPVSLKAATEFTAAFYRGLAEDRPLEDAVTQGRLAILVADMSTFEWATPVLFLRSRTGKVLDLDAPVKARAEEPAGRDIVQTHAGRDVTIIGGDSIYAGRDAFIGRRPRKW